MNDQQPSSSRGYSGNENNQGGNSVYRITPPRGSSERIKIWKPTPDGYVNCDVGLDYPFLNYLPLEEIARDWQRGRQAAAGHYQNYTNLPIYNPTDDVERYPGGYYVEQEYRNQRNPHVPNGSPKHNRNHRKLPPNVKMCIEMSARDSHVELGYRNEIDYNVLRRHNYTELRLQHNGRNGTTYSKLFARPKTPPRSPQGRRSLSECRKGSTTKKRPPKHEYEAYATPRRSRRHEHVHKCCQMPVRPRKQLPQVPHMMLHTRRARLEGSSPRRVCPPNPVRRTEPPPVFEKCTPRQLLPNQDPHVMLHTRRARSEGSSPRRVCPPNPVRRTEPPPVFEKCRPRQLLPNQDPHVMLHTQRARSEGSSPRRVCPPNPVRRTEPPPVFEKCRPRQLLPNQDPHVVLHTRRARSEGSSPRRVCPPNPVRRTEPPPVFEKCRPRQLLPNQDPHVILILGEEHVPTPISEEAPMSSKSKGTSNSAEQCYASNLEAPYPADKNIIIRMLWRGNVWYCSSVSKWYAFVREYDQVSEGIRQMNRENR